MTEPLRRRAGAPPAGPQRGARAAADLDRAAAGGSESDHRAAGADRGADPGRRAGLGEQQHRQPAACWRRRTGANSSRRCRWSSRRCAMTPPTSMPRMDFATRDRLPPCGRAMARISPLPAKSTWLRAAVQARRRDGIAARPIAAAHRAHVGYYLIGAGQAELERVVQVRLPLVATRAPHRGAPPAAAVRPFHHDAHAAAERWRGDVGLRRVRVGVRGASRSALVVAADRAPRCCWRPASWPWR